MTSEMLQKPRLIMKDGIPTQTLLEVWSAATRETVIPDGKLSDQRKLDSKDTTLGSLPNYMKQYWIFLEKLRAEVESLTYQLGDLYMSHQVDRERYGKEMPDEIKKAFRDRCIVIQTKIQEPVFAYSINRLVFCEMLNRSFPLPEGKSIHGIREGYEVVCRDYDDRGDGRNVVETWNLLATRLNADTGLNWILEAALKAFEPQASPSPSSPTSTAA